MPVAVHMIPMGLSLAYLLESPAGLVLVDAGLPRQESRVLRRMEALGRGDLRLIFLTHAHLDHYGSAAALRQATGAAIAIHEADAQDLTTGRTVLGQSRGWGRLLTILLPLLVRITRPEPTRPDILVEDGDDLSEFAPAARVLHTPGHTAGSSTLIVDGQLAFVGDLISTTGKPHAQRFFAQEWQQVPQSVNRLLALGPKRIYAGHGHHPLDGQTALQLLSSLGRGA